MTGHVYGPHRPGFRETAKVGHPSSGSDPERDEPVDPAVLAQREQINTLAYRGAL